MTDTSKEAVETAICRPVINMVNTGASPSLDECGAMIDVARALSARVAELEVINGRYGEEVRRLNRELHEVKGKLEERK